MSNNVLTLQQITTIAERWINEINVKRLETGYAETQPDWPYWVQPMNYSAFEWADMDTWVRATFGDTNWSHKGRWVGSSRKYWFRDAADRTWFVLRWS